MRRPITALSLMLLSLTLVACTAAVAPGWTYAPPTPAAATPAASAGASATPTAAPTAAPSAAEASGGAAGGTVVQVSAQNIAFEQSDISAPADTPFTIHFDNKDPSTPHDIAIKDASGNQVFKGDVITGPAQTDYQVPALPAGTYQFVCTIHPNMVGTLTVGG